MIIAELSVFLWMVFPFVCGVGYMNTNCNESVTIMTSDRLESSTGLIYLSGMYCTYLVIVPHGNYVLALFRRFELEGQETGACMDYVDFYDGVDITALKLNSDPICGSSPPNNVTSSGNNLFLVFSTDNSANYRGFDVIFTAATNAPCSVNQFACDNGVCISSDLKCDNYNQCGDNSDEASCETTETAVTSDQLGLIIGATCGIIAFLVISTVTGVYAYKRRKLHNFLKDPVLQVQTWEVKESYPVTSAYRKWATFGYLTLKDQAKSNENMRHPEPEVIITYSGASTSDGQTVPQAGTSKA